MSRSGLVAWAGGRVVITIISATPSSLRAAKASQRSDMASAQCASSMNRAVGRASARFAASQ